MSGSASGKLRLRDDRLKGTVDCAGGGTAEIDLGFREKDFSGTVGSEQVSGSFVEALPEPGASAGP